MVPIHGPFGGYEHNTLTTAKLRSLANALGLGMGVCMTEEVCSRLSKAAIDRLSNGDR